MALNNDSFRPEEEQGLIMSKALTNWVSAIALAGILGVGGALVAGAQETKKKHPSDRTVDFLRTFVEGFLIPDEIERSDGTKIKVNLQDKAEMAQFAIPRDDMRRIIRIAHSGANAEICNRIDLQQNAYKWVKFSETKKKKWSEKQLYFISRLYVATVIWQTGQASAVVKDENAEKTSTQTQQPLPESKKTIECTDSKKEAVKRLEAFLKEKESSGG